MCCLRGSNHRFLPPKNMYRQWRSSFDGTIENGEALKHRDDKFVFEMVKNINLIFGKPVKGIKRKRSEKPPKDSPFKKQSIFIRYLPCWKEFEIGHAIDTMDVEKGVFESTIGLLLDIPRDGNGSGRAITRPPAKRLRVEIHTRTHICGYKFIPIPVGFWAGIGYLSGLLFHM
jgi:hypothetical protein